ncbi:hypothetical protein Dcar01_03434 [Deinococcus carri]|uniref:WD40 repeat domain-containing protein n=1 Tax=Deinococcus carri TaxID=1211323 RepID=A0ABP9WBI5_9DEIO
MRRLFALLAALSLSAQAAPSALIPPEPLELVGIAPDAAPGQPGAPVTGVLAVRAYGGSTVKLYDAATARQRREVLLPPEVVLTVPPALSPDGKWLAVALTPDPDTREGRVGILSTFPVFPPAFRVVLKSEGLRGSRNFAFSPDGTRLAVGNRDGYVQLWDWQAGQRLNTVKSTIDPDWLSFSPDGRFFTPHFRGQTATQLLDGHTGAPVNTLRGVGYGMFTPDGHFIASGGRYLSLPSGEKVTSPAYLKGGVTVQGYSRDGKRVLVQLPTPASTPRPHLTFARGRRWANAGPPHP